MSFRTGVTRIAAMFQKNRLEQELNEDIREHLEMATEENLRRGMNPREAAEAARRSFGGAEQMKEEFRDQRGIPPLETLLREIRIAFRSLRRAPSFTFLAILTLALSIGANSAIFSAVNALLFNPAGISEPRRLVVVRAKYGKLNLHDLVISQIDFKDVSDSSEIFSAAAIAKSGDLTYTGGAVPQRLSSLRVSWRWFEIFGARPTLGRLFAPEEDRPDNNQVVVLSHQGWQRLFGGDPSIVGKTVELNQNPYKVVGVMSATFSLGVNELGGPLGQGEDIFVPLAERDDPRTRATETYLAVARLRPGIDFAKAREYMSVLTSRGIQTRQAGRFLKGSGWGLFIVPYTDFSGGDMKTPLLILWGAVGFVLLIACANIAGLTLARTSARSRELAVRTALGGSRWHLLRQLFAESAILAVAGSILGLGVAYLFIRGVEIWGPENVVGGLKIPFDVSMLVFTAVSGILSGILFGIAPAGQLQRGNTGEALKDGGRSGTTGRDRARLRSVLVTAEVALALVLSIGAGLLMRSLSRLQQVDVGFRADGIMTASVTLPEARFQDSAKQTAFYRAALQRLAAIPGVTSSAAAYPLPFGAGFEGRGFQIVGRPLQPDEPFPQANARLVTPDYFTTLRIPVKRGRVFTEQDSAAAERVAIIDETLAQKYWPNQDPVGQQFIPLGGIKSKIVGIVGHTKESNLASGSDQGVFYYSYYQDPVPLPTFIIRTPGNPAVLTGAMQQAVSSVEPAKAIYDAKTMEDRVSATLAARRFTVVLLGLFAAMAVFLAALGLYGVINYGVTQRTQEIGIRMALGAQRPQILSLIVGQGLRIALIGLAVGGIVAVELAAWVPNQLFGVGAFDPVTFLSMAVLLAAVTLLASYIPARRAMKLDPLEACRYE